MSAGRNTLIESRLLGNLYNFPPNQHKSVGLLILANFYILLYYWFWTYFLNMRAFSSFKQLLNRKIALSPEVVIFVFDTLPATHCQFWHGSCLLSWSLSSSFVLIRTVALIRDLMSSTLQPLQSANMQSFLLESKEYISTIICWSVGILPQATFLAIALARTETFSYISQRQEDFGIELLNIVYTAL